MEESRRTYIEEQLKKRGIKVKDDNGKYRKLTDVLLDMDGSSNQTIFKETAIRKWCLGCDKQITVYEDDYVHYRCKKFGKDLETVDFMGGEICGILCQECADEYSKGLTGGND